LNQVLIIILLPQNVSLNSSRGFKSVLNHFSVATRLGLVFMLSLEDRKIYVGHSPYRDCRNSYHSRVIIIPRTAEDCRSTIKG